MRLFILLFITLLLSACNDNNEQQNDKFDQKYRIDECIVKVNIDRTDMSLERAEKLQNYITPQGIINAYRDERFPHFSVVSSRIKLEYYFFFSYQCDKKLDLVNTIVPTYFLRSKYNKGFKAKSVTLASLPDDLSRPVNKWLDH